MVGRRRVGLGEAFKAAGAYWDWGDDPLGLIPLVLYPLTTLWYWIRGMKG
jgi:hypothetical protein